MKFEQTVWLICLGFLAISEIVNANTCSEIKRNQGKPDASRFSPNYIFPHDIFPCDVFPQKT